MVAVKAANANAFVKSPPATATAYLFFGSDPGLVSERAGVLAKMLAARENPAGEVLRLDDTNLDEDTGRLAVELQTRPMFSGRKIVRATAGRRITAQLLKSLVTDGPLEGLLIVEAGNLKPEDALRALFEGAASAAAIPCYPDTGADLGALIADVLQGFKIAIESDARTLLISRLGADRTLSRNEIEKLALYAQGRASITVDDVEAIVGDAADLALERITEAAASGNAAAAITDYGRAITSGESAQAVILITQRYFLKLHKLRSDVDGGQSLDDALRALRPPVHFKQRDALTAQVRNWSRARLDQALKRIAEAAKAARLSSALEETLGERLILALAAMAQPRLSEGAARRR
jgi:DNA polymerase III subunit delta